MRNYRFDVRPTSGALGAEILGVDLADGLEQSDVDELRSALNEYGVIFFRDQKLSPEQHIAFAERFGQIDINRFFKAAPGYPQIAEVRKEPEQKTNIGGGWHTDHSYDQIPALGSILLARETPPRGGDTMFACMNLAYEALSDGLKKTLEGMRAVHSSRHVFGAAAPLRESLQAVSGGPLDRRAAAVLKEAVELLRQVAEAGMFEAIERGWFADTPRPRDGGRGLEGVARRAPAYHNPFLELWEPGLAEAAGA